MTLEMGRPLVQSRGEVDVWNHDPEVWNARTVHPGKHRACPVDYQVGTMQLIRYSSADVSLRNAVLLATAAVKLKMPIVLTSSQEDRIQGPISPALAKAAPVLQTPRQTRRHRERLGRPEPSDCVCC